PAPDVPASRPPGGATGLSQGGSGSICPESPGSLRPLGCPAARLPAPAGLRRALERHEQSLDATRTDATLHLRRGDRLQPPALRRLLVEDVLQLVARHLAAEHLLADLHDLVCVSHATDRTGSPAPSSGTSVSP